MKNLILPLYLNINKVLLLALFPLVLFFSCTCRNNDEVNYVLSEFERSVIPFTSEQEVEYINELTNIFTATVSPKIVEKVNLNASDDESCMATIVDFHRNELIINSTEERFIIKIRKDKSNKTEFNIIYQSKFFGIDNCNTEIYDAENFLRDIIIDGFSFTNVFSFELCGINSNINTIIYSVENGIEFIKYNDDSYLKLI